MLLFIAYCGNYYHIRFNNNIFKIIYLLKYQRKVKIKEKSKCFYIIKWRRIMPQNLNSLSSNNILNSLHRIITTNSFKYHAQIFQIRQSPISIWRRIMPQNPNSLKFPTSKLYAVILYNITPTTTCPRHGIIFMLCQNLS